MSKSLRLLVVCATLVLLVDVSAAPVSPAPRRLTREECVCNFIGKLNPSKSGGKTSVDCPCDSQGTSDSVKTAIDDLRACLGETSFSNETFTCSYGYPPVTFSVR